MKPHFLLLCLLSFFCIGVTETAVPTPTTDASFYKKLGEANQEIVKQNYSKAASLLDEAEKIKPNMIESSNLRGSLYLQQKDYSKAYEIFLKNATLAPDNIGAQYNLAEAEFVQKTYPASRDRLTKLIEIVKATPKEKINTLPFGEITVDFFNYKIYLTYLFEDNSSEAKKMLDKFDPYSLSPIYYFGCSAMEFYNKNNLKGLEWIGSAAKIYNAQLIALFSDSLFEHGWIRKGAKPGEISTDLAPVEKK